MKTTIDRFGRLVVPKTIRERLGLRPGDEIEIEEQDNRIVLKNVEERYPLQVEDGVLIFSGTASSDLLVSVTRHREERLSKLSMRKSA
jgi:AbrB family looped-hinge helix DNA binding protein